MKEATIRDGRVIRQEKDGTHHVSEAEAKFLIKSGAFVRVGTSLGTAQATGFRCQDCGFLAAIRDHCGRCGGTTLVAE